MKKKRKPNQQQIREYQGFIQAVKDMAEDMPDGAYLATLESETERWLSEKGFAHLCEYDFMMKYGL
ncbi:hypothetical protein FE589_08755 [Mannheimia varigena]|nr:hypothetical protein FE589_08755 [Mannheimia varigena]